MTSALRAAFAARYPSGEYSVLYEVSDATGGRASRRADAVVMSCWPSRGLWLAGFEWKVSRSDWIREKTDPEKSAAVQQYCDHWWVVAGDETIVRDGELPKTWGLLVLKAGKLVTVVDAPKLEAKTCTRGFLASMLRNAQKGYVPQGAVDAMVEERAAARAKQLAGPEGRFVEKYGELQAQHDDLLKRVQAFEGASGVAIQHWNAETLDDVKRIGTAVGLLTGSGWNRDPFRRATESLKQAQKAVADAERELDAALPPKLEAVSGGKR